MQCAHSGAKIFIEHALMFGAEGKNLGHHIIELNGKQYDATTGALLGESRIKAVPKASGAVAPKRQGRVIDGFIAPAARRPKTLAPALAKPPLPKLVSVREGNVNITKAHKPERSKTLMRHVVPKPQAHLKPAIKVSKPAELMARPKSEITIPLEKKLSVRNVDPQRLGKAKRVSKSQHIQHFVKSKQAAVSLPMPKASPVNQRPAAPATLPAKPAEERKRVSVDEIFEAAIMRSTNTTPASTRANNRSRRGSKLTNAFAAIAAFLIIGGFVAYVNATKIELRVASVRAGFGIQTPAANPAGFALNKIESEKGKAVLSFNYGDKNYRITQEQSNLNSQTLLDQYIFIKGVPTQTIQNNGRTIYLYGNNTATWVSGGIHYDITGNLSDIDLSSLISNM